MTFLGPSRLTHSRHGWFHDICTAWQDRLQPGTPVFIHVVQPHPPESDLQSFVAHVIIEQHPMPGLAAAVLTAFMVADNDNRLIQRAASLQRWIDSVDVVDALALNHVCEVRRCTAWIGSRPIPLVPRTELNVACSIVLYIPPMGSEQVTDVEPDLLDLRQTRIALHRPVEHKLDGDPIESSIVQCPTPAEIPQEQLPNIQEQEPFIQDLHRLWGPIATLGPGRMERRAFVVVWFLDAVRMPECHLARAASLHEDFTQWSEEILRVWQDFIRPDMALNAYLVQPQPPAMEPGVLGHVILMQQPIIHACAVLLSIFDSAVAEGQVMRFATFVSVPATHERLIAAAHKEHLCDPWQLQNFCATFHGNIQLRPQVDFPVANGHEFTLVIRRTLEQTDCNEKAGFPQFTQHASGQTEPPTQAEDISEKSLDEHVTTWFVDATNQPVCYKPRLIQRKNNQDMTLPIEDFREAWTDCLRPFDAISLVSISLDSASRIHFIGFRTATQPNLIPIIAEARMAETSRVEPVRRAALVPHDSTVRVVWDVFGIDHSLVDRERAQCCSFTRDGKTCEPNDMIGQVDGTWVAFSWDPVSIAALPIKVDFTAVIKTHELLDSHFLLPTYDLPPDYPWLPASWDWVQGPWWTPGWIGHEIRLYYDGSSSKKESGATAGCAVAAFIRTQNVWCFAGALSTTLAQGTTSYKAELLAAVVAHTSFCMIYSSCSRSLKTLCQW